MSALLKFIPFSALSNWSVKYLNGVVFNYNPDFKLVKIGDFLIRNKTTLEVQNHIKYKRVTIKMNNGGVFLRNMEVGSKIGTKNQFLIKQGQFILSKIDARNGAFGVVTEEVDNAIITGNFWTFDVDTRVIIPDFLSLITTTKHFLIFCQMASNGTTGRHYLQEDEFLNMKIPLPSIEEQENILDIYNKNKDLSKNQTGEVSEKSDYIEDFLKSSLGIEEIKVKKAANLLMLTRFKTLDVWSVDNIVRKNTFDSNLLKLTCLEDQPSLVKEVFRGKSPKYKEQTNSKILNQKCIRFNSIEVKHAKSVDSNWLNKVDSIFLTKENDILINSTGDGTIGRASIVSKDHEGLLYDSHIILLRLNTKLIDPLFFVYFNNSKLGQKQIENIKSAKSTKQTELGVGNLLKLQFPLPDIDIQREIVLEIKNLETQIEDLKIKSIKNSNSAIAEFEKAIFIK